MKLDYNRHTRTFQVLTELSVYDSTPYCEVLPYGSVSVGDITLTRDAIAKLYFLSHSEPHMVHDGYVHKGNK
jgi:hypothetical protein